MEKFSVLLALCAENSPVTDEFPSQSQRRGTLIFSLICAWTNSWANNRDAGDWRRHCAHYDVTVMRWRFSNRCSHYTDVIMGTITSQITSLTIVYSTVYSDADQRKHQSSASLAFVRGLHRDRWIPHTNGQLRGKCFHLMTSSCQVSKSHRLMACTLY